MARNPNDRGQTYDTAAHQAHLQDPEHPAYWTNLQQRLDRARRLPYGHPRRRAIMESITGPMTPQNAAQLEAKEHSGRFGPFTQHQPLADPVVPQTRGLGAS